MSADNGIYVARFLHPDSFEYRVAHLQNIENCDDDGNRPKGHDQAWEGTPRDKEEVDNYRVVAFGRARLFFSLSEAIAYAQSMERDIMESSFPVLEYGICEIVYDRPILNKTRKEAMAWIDKYVWGES